MTPGQWFFVFWAALALAIGSVFLFAPMSIVRARRRRDDVMRPPERIRKQLGYQFGRHTVVVYRVVGALAIVIGVAVGVGSLLGVLRPE